MFILIRARSTIEGSLLPDWPLFNRKKLTRRWDIIRDLQKRVLTFPYMFARIPVLQEYLSVRPEQAEDVLYQASLCCEPRDSSHQTGIPLSDNYK
jgi:hypothetical protein